jgi:hypothetical protein
MEFIFSFLDFPFVSAIVLFVMLVWGLIAVNCNKWGQAAFVWLISVFVLSHRYGIDLQYVKDNASLFVYSFTVSFTLGLVSYGLLSGGFLTLHLATNKLIKTKNQLFKENQFASPAFLDDRCSTASRALFAKMSNDRYGYSSLITRSLLTKYKINNTVRPKVVYKSNITWWIALWPLAVVWTWIDDPVCYLVNFIFTRFKNLYEVMSKAVFNRI